MKLTLEQKARLLIDGEFFVTSDGRTLGPEEVETVKQEIDSKHESPARLVIRKSLEALADDLQAFEQTTHGHIPIREPIADVAECLAAAYRCPGAYEISNLSQSIRRLLKET